MNFWKDISGKSYSILKKSLYAPTLKKSADSKSVYLPLVALPRALMSWSLKNLSNVKSGMVKIPGFDGSLNLTKSEDGYSGSVTSKDKTLFDFTNLSLAALSGTILNQCRLMDGVAGYSLKSSEVKDIIEKSQSNYLDKDLDVLQKLIDKVVEFNPAKLEKAKVYSFADRKLIGDSESPEVVSAAQSQTATAIPQNSDMIEKHPLLGSHRIKDRKYADLAAKIMARFGEDQPRHFIESLHELHDEPYSHGDIHNIQWGKHDKIHNRPMPFPRQASPESVGGHLGKRVHTGSADPLPWMDLKYGVAAKILDEHKDSPLKISTRSDLIAHDDYISKLNPEKHSVEIHIPGLDDEIARTLEPGAPSVKRRLWAAKRLKEAGIPVTLVHDIIDPKHRHEMKHQDLNDILVSSAAGTHIPFRTNHIKPDSSAAQRIKSQFSGIGASLPKTATKKSELSKSAETRRAQMKELVRRNITAKEGSPEYWSQYEKVLRQMPHKGKDPLDTKDTGNVISYHVGLDDKGLPKEPVASVSTDDTAPRMPREGVSAQGGAVRSNKVQEAKILARRALEKLRAQKVLNLPKAELEKKQGDSPTRITSPHSKGVFDDEGAFDQGKSKVGVHLDRYASPETSKYKKPGVVRWAKGQHNKKLAELRAMPKPNLPKAELEKAKMDERVPGQSKEQVRSERKEAIHVPTGTTDAFSAKGKNTPVGKMTRLLNLQALREDNKLNKAAPKWQAQEKTKKIAPQQATPRAEPYKGNKQRPLVGPQDTAARAPQESRVPKAPKSPAIKGVKQPPVPKSMKVMGSVTKDELDSAKSDIGKRIFTKDEYGRYKFNGSGLWAIMNKSSVEIRKNEDDTYSVYTDNNWDSDNLRLLSLTIKAKSLLRKYGF